MCIKQVFLKANKNIVKANRIIYKIKLCKDRLSDNKFIRLRLRKKQKITIYKTA